jgi:hypothetical protein
VLNDLSLGEIASEQGISRQAVHDVIRRSTKALEEYEEKLLLIQKFVYIKERVAEINTLASAATEQSLDEIMAQMITISNEILEEL